MNKAKAYAQGYRAAMGGWLATPNHLYKYPEYYEAYNKGWESGFFDKHISKSMGGDYVRDSA